MVKVNQNISINDSSFFFTDLDHSTSQSETESEELIENHIQENSLNYSVQHIDFDNGENDSK
jgi:hypothetical protein